MQRIRIDAVTSWRIDDCARRTGRSSHTEALAFLVKGGYDRLFAGAAASNTDAPPAIDDGAVRGRTIALHAKPSTVAGIERFASAEGRSLSAAMQTLIRESLERRGLLPSPQPAACAAA